MRRTGINASISATARVVLILANPSRTGESHPSAIGAAAGDQVVGQLDAGILIEEAWLSALEPT